MQLIWFYSNSSLNLKLKIMERNFFIWYQLSAKLHLRKRVTIVFFLLSHLPWRRLRKQGQLPLGCTVNVLARFSVTLQPSSQSCSMKISQSGNWTTYFLCWTHLCSPFTPFSPSRIFLSWTPTPSTAYLVSQPNSRSLAHMYHKAPFLWINILSLWRLSIPACTMFNPPGFSHTN